LVLVVLVLMAQMMEQHQVLQHRQTHTTYKEKVVEEGTLMMEMLVDLVLGVVTKELLLVHQINQVQIQMQTPLIMEMLGELQQELEDLGIILLEAAAELAVLEEQLLLTNQVLEVLE